MRGSGPFREHRPQHAVRPPDVTGAPPPGDEREDLLGLGTRRLLLALRTDVRQFSQGDLQGHRHMIKAVDGNRLLPALDLADELAAQPRTLPEPLLAQASLLAEGAQPLTEELPDVLDRSFSHRESSRGPTALPVSGHRDALGHRMQVRRAAGVRRSWSRPYRGCHGTSISTASSRTRAGYTGTLSAGSTRQRPVASSKSKPCQGHTTASPSSQPSFSGPSSWGQTAPQANTRPAPAWKTATPVPFVSTRMP